jgi:hypothetical protein
MVMSTSRPTSTSTSTSTSVFSRSFALAGLFLLGGGCGGSPALRAAERGDRNALQQALTAQQSSGTLSNGEAAAIAAQVARRELLDASPADAPARVLDVLPCARELDDALAERMRVHDGAGADAALARISSRGMSMGAAREFAGDADGPWRAVGARALVRDEDRGARQRALVDVDPRVRRQAARAALEAADGADLAALAETARLDPEPIVRTEAVRAIAAIRTPAGTSGDRRGPWAAQAPGYVPDQTPAVPVTSTSAADLLRDLWMSGDDGLREDIALAWAGPSLWDAGGREALRTLVASGHGPGAIEGAAAILRHGDADPESTQAAIGQLVRAIAGGSRATRLQAIAQAPIDMSPGRSGKGGAADLLGAVRAAAADEDLEVRVGALARLASAAVSDATERAAAVTALEGLAQPTSEGPPAERARFALATAGDRRVQAWIEDGLRAAHPDERLGAAVALANLGVASRAAPLLSDPDAEVRTRGACTIVMAARVAR